MDSARFDSLRAFWMAGIRVGDHDEPVLDGGGLVFDGCEPVLGGNDFAAIGDGLF
jgi:hypothetical protein